MEPLTPLGDVKNYSLAQGAEERAAKLPRGLVRRPGQPGEGVFIFAP